MKRHFEDDRVWLDTLRMFAGLPPKLSPEELTKRVMGKDSAAELYMSQWSPTFEELMRNRLVMGALRYGRIGSPNKPKYDRVKSIVHRAQEYQKTGNKEWLVDIANEALLEFAEPAHPNPVWDPTDDADYHTESVK